MLLVSTVVSVLGRAQACLLHRLRIPHIHLIIVIPRRAYGKEANRCDYTPVLRACETLDGVAREAGLGDGAAALSVELLGSHCDYGGCEVC